LVHNDDEHAISKSRSALCRIIIRCMDNAGLECVSIHWCMFKKRVTASLRQNYRYMHSPVKIVGCKITQQFCRPLISPTYRRGDEKGQWRHLKGLPSPSTWVSFYCRDTIYDQQHVPSACRDVLLTVLTRPSHVTYFQELLFNNNPCYNNRLSSELTDTHRYAHVYTRTHATPLLRFRKRKAIKSYAFRSFTLCSNMIGTFFFAKSTKP
jgi:hypothetical protein